MHVPNAELAVIDDRKLLEYALDPTHPRGRYKARVFLSALGLGNDEMTVLRTALLNSVVDCPVIATRTDGYGTTYTVDFTMAHRGRSARVRGVWRIKEPNSAPRLLTCHVL